MGNASIMESKQANYQNRIGDYLHDRTEQVGTAVVPNFEDRNNSVVDRSRTVIGLHKDPSEEATSIDSINPVVKTVVAGRELTTDALEAGTSVLTKGFKGIKAWMANQIGDNSSSGNIKKLALTVLTGIFGVSTIKALMDGLQNVFGAKGVKSSPLLLTGAKFLAGSALTLGVYRALTGAAGQFTVGTILLGLFGYLVLSLLKNNYESPNSVSSKLLGAIGLRDRSNTLIDTVGMRDTEKTVNEGAM